MSWVWNVGEKEGVKDDPRILTSAIGRFELPSTEMDKNGGKPGLWRRNQEFSWNMLHLRCLFDLQEGMLSRQLDRCIWS